ncbi:hypothetical protein OESDEN_18615 [Oesophagostomum dentatum]|uniref:SCP domain-containing protein n=1 Tax=Oesophagostomum dentatum TaxID=61180 RepID=A0A0B1SDV8_OESDE|nr:hypothetical protein OESDEN_18615 [Oesophagostomum dentatum]
MAWARTNKLGCSIARCSDEYVTVCRYLEKGNVVRQQVYIPGRLCSMCTSGCDQDGLCY